MIAHRVATPVLGLRGRGVVAGAVRDAAYLDLDGFLIAVTARGVPLMPNGIALTERPRAWPRRGTPVTLAPGRLTADGWDVRWPAEDPPVWHPIPPTIEPDAALADAIPPDARVEPFAAALTAGDTARAAEEAAGLIGRGGGLTPEGDDLVAGALAAAAALARGAPAAAATLARGSPAAAPPPVALARRSSDPAPPPLPPDFRARTTALSATLLALAAAGAVIEPVHGLFGPRWRPALARLARVGHSTGRAYAAGVGTVLRQIGSRAT